MPLHALRRAGYKQVLVTYHDTYTSASNASSYTTGTINIGTATADRLVVAVVSSAVFGNSVARPLTTCNIGGTAGTIHGTDDVAVTNCPQIAIASRLVTSGTTTTVNAVFSSTNSCCRISVYTVTNWSNQTPSIYSDPVTSGAADVAVTLSRPGGILVGGATNILTTQTYTTTSTGPGAVTEDVDGSPRSGCGTTAVHLDNGSGAPTVSFTPDGTIAGNVGMLALWY